MKTIRSESSRAVVGTIFHGLSNGASNSSRYGRFTLGAETAFADLLESHYGFSTLIWGGVWTKQGGPTTNVLDV